MTETESISHKNKKKKSSDKIYDGKFPSEKKCVSLSQLVTRDNRGKYNK